MCCPTGKLSQLVAGRRTDIHPCVFILRHAVEVAPECRTLGASPRLATAACMRDLAQVGSGRMVPRWFSYLFHDPNGISTHSMTQKVFLASKSSQQHIPHLHHVTYPIRFPLQPWLDTGTTITKTLDKRTVTNTMPGRQQKLSLPLPTLSGPWSSCFDLWSLPPCINASANHYGKSLHIQTLLLLLAKGERGKQQL